MTQPESPTSQTGADRPTLYLMVGLPGAGKTTRAKQIEVERHALRFTPDDWILELYGNDLDRPGRDAVRDPVEALQWKVARRALRLGCSVILDWGFWSLSERVAYQREAEALGALLEVVYLDVAFEELWSRISRRDESQSGTLQISRAELEEWAAMFEAPIEGE